MKTDNDIFRLIISLIVKSNSVSLELLKEILNADGLNVNCIQKKVLNDALNETLAYPDNPYDTEIQKFFGCL